jgi:hypothetical protein
VREKRERRQATKPQSEKNLEVFPAVHAADSSMRPQGCAKWLAPLEIEHSRQ